MTKTTPTSKVFTRILGIPIGQRVILLTLNKREVEGTIVSEVGDMDYIVDCDDNFHRLRHISELRLLE